MHVSKKNDALLSPPAMGSRKRRSATTANRAKLLSIVDKSLAQLHLLARTCDTKKVFSAYDAYALACGGICGVGQMHSGRCREKIIARAGGTPTLRGCGNACRQEQ